MLMETWKKQSSCERDFLVSRQKECVIHNIVLNGTCYTFYYQGQFRHLQVMSDDKYIGVFGFVTCKHAIGLQHSKSTHHQTLTFIATPTSSIFSLMGFISCTSFPTINSRIPSTRFSKQSTLPSLYTPKLALRREDKPSFTLSLSKCSIMVTPVKASSSSTIGETSDGLKKVQSHVSIGADDLLIVGPGVLGRLVAEKWREEHSDCQIFGQTVTTNHHDELEKLGIKPSLKETEFDGKFSFVIFCAPPSQSPDYAAELRMAASKWNGEGSFLFTSSSAPYDCFDNEECNEDSPVVPLGKSPRTDVLLRAEQVVLEKHHIMFLLNFVYTETRGAHTYWLSKETVDARPDHILNLIHYEDAASLAVAIMKKKAGGRIFVGCDNHPLSRQEVMDLMDQSGKYDKKFKGFTSTSGPLGKKLNNSRTREEIGWEPKYPSFAQFLGVSK
ncbi:hypothetical protein Bca101_017818 [Brassica carinata]